MPAPAVLPLSHHEIIALVAPFTAAGWSLDLAASERAQRRLLFRPAAPRAGAPALQLLLEGLPTGSWQLRRLCQHPATAAAPAGLQASAQALGLAPAALLALVQQVDVERHFRSGPGYLLARDYEVLANGLVLLRRGQLLLAGAGPALQLTLAVPAVRGVAADIELLAPREALALPEDLLAVLGWNWTRLLSPRAGTGRWKSKLRLRGRLPARSAAAERALDSAAAHLAQTLAEPPAQFHQRHRLARLGVVARRVIPLATPLLLVATILLMPRLDIEQGMGLWWLLYHVPTVLIMLSFTLQELPTLALPPWPRRSTAPDWRAA
jgi:hypothetical protein